MSAPSAPIEPARHGAAFFDGLRASLASVFFYVVIGNFTGIGALSHEFGFSLGWTALSTVLIWAAPAQVILISTFATATPFEIAFAVSLSSLRFLPMVTALLPMLKHGGTRQRDLLLPTHLTSISVWVEGMRLLPAQPRERRVGFYNGFGCGLLGAAVLANLAGFYLAAKLPPLVAATLLFLTPMSLLMSVSRNSRSLIDRLAFLLGLVVGPVLAARNVGLDLMWTGIIGGSAAYLVHRLREALA